MYQQGSINETYGDNWLSSTFYNIRSIFHHTLPYLCSMSVVFLTDVVFLETDWYLIMICGLLYTLMNCAIAHLSNNNTMYFMDWAVITQIQPYNPLVSCFAFVALAVAHHFFLCMLTQMLCQRFEFEFSDVYDMDINKDPAAGGTT